MNQNSWMRSPVVRYPTLTFLTIWLTFTIACFIFYLSNKNFEVYLPQVELRYGDVSIMLAKFSTLSLLTLFAGICTLAADWAFYGSPNSLIVQNSPLLNDPYLFVEQSASIFRSTGFSRAVLLTPLMVVGTLSMLVVFDFLVYPVPFTFEIFSSQMYLVIGITFVILWIINAVQNFRRYA